MCNTIFEKLEDFKRTVYDGCKNEAAMLGYHLHLQTWDQNGLYIRASFAKPGSVNVIPKNHQKELKLLFDPYQDQGIRIEPYFG